MDDVVWTKDALKDLDEIGAYIAIDNPDAAAKAIIRIGEAAAGLSFFPRIGRDGRVQGTRELVISDTPYILIYRVRDRVEILRIRHGAQRWPV